MFQFNHRSFLLLIYNLSTVCPLTLPLAVPHLAYEPYDRVIGHLLQLPDQLREQRWPFADDVLEVGGDFSGHGQEHVGVDLELARQFAGCFLRGGGDFASFYLTEVGGLDAHAFGYLADRVLGVVLPQCFAAGSDVLGESRHMCSVYYIVYVCQGREHEGGAGLSADPILKQDKAIGCLPTTSGAVVMKAEIQLIVGKTIAAVVISERNNPGPPKSQVFLVFDDATTYELYGDVAGSGALDVGGTKWAVNYAKKFKGKITVYGDEEIGSDLTEWSRIGLQGPR